MRTRQGLLAGLLGIVVLLTPQSATAARDGSSGVPDVTYTCDP